MLRFLYKNIGQTESVFQDYDCDIAMSSGGNGSPMLDFAHGVLAPQDGHFNVQGVVDLRDGHCLL